MTEEDQTVGIMDYILAKFKSNDISQDTAIQSIFMWNMVKDVHIHADCSDGTDHRFMFTWNKDKHRMIVEIENMGEFGELEIGWTWFYWNKGTDNIWTLDQPFGTEVPQKVKETFQLFRR